MFKSILVAPAGTRQTRTAIETAVTFARPFGAHIECLRIHSDPAQMLARAAAADMGTGMVVADMWKALSEEDATRTAKLRSAFEEICKREKIAAAERPAGSAVMTAWWREETGDEIPTLVKRSRFHDAVVVEHPSDGGYLAGGGGTLLIESGRPIIIAPPEAPKTFPRTIVVAWKDRPEAARAITAAMPLLEKAERVCVLSINEDSSDEAVERQSLQDASDYLRWHGLKVESSYVASGAKTGPDAMVAMIGDLKAEALVMGGYGHSRMREFIFGGFTRQVLAGLDLPVFLLH
jgi:nucleotide-binding universal stress UspA family protein